MFAPSSAAANQHVDAKGPPTKKQMHMFAPPAFGTRGARAKKVDANVCPCFGGPLTQEQIRMLAPPALWHARRTEKMLDAK